jgi:hypothetical protein
LQQVYRRILYTKCTQTQPVAAFHLKKEPPVAIDRILEVLKYQPVLYQKGYSLGEARACFFLSKPTHS